MAQILKKSRSSRLFMIGLGFLFVSLLSPRAHADVGVVLNESLNTSVARITGSGHTAVYFSNICPENPIKLRLCHAGENGSVISNYTTLGEDKPFEWNVVPLNIYLYGVENAADRPLVGTETIKSLLEERYRNRYLAGYCETKSCQTSDKAEWREMVAASLSRSIYIFVVASAPEQDRALIEEFNSLPNVNHFNGMTRNCADFARRIINTYFPKATRGDYINDFGMTSPKAIARSFTRYALRHPDAQFRVLHIAQAPGTLKRSTQVRTGTEQLYRSKKLLVPMLLFAAHELPAVAASYLLIGRFNPQATWEKYPTIEASETTHQLLKAKSEKQRAQIETLEAERSHIHEQVVGTSQEWQENRWQFNANMQQANDRGVIPQGEKVGSIFKQLKNTSAISVDANGAMWADLPLAGGQTRVGLSASNVLAADSDAALAHRLLLGRNERILKSPKHARESMAEYREDWARLQRAGERRINSLSASERPAGEGAETAAGDVHP